MSSNVLVLNRGPKPIQVTGSLIASPTFVEPGKYAEFWVHEGEPLQLEEDGVVVSPNLAGGHGEE